jgi:ABC-2 type transport system permease protein
VSTTAALSGTPADETFESRAHQLFVLVSRFRGTWVLFSRAMVVGLRTPVFGFVFPIVFPVAILVFVSQMYAKIIVLPGFPTTSYAAYLGPAAVTVIPMMGAGYGATGLIIDEQTGFLDRLRLFPITAGSIVGAKSLFEIARIIPAFVVVLALSVFMGAPLIHGALSVLVLLVIVALWSVAYSGLFYLVGLRSRNPQAPVALLPLVVPLLFVSSALMPRGLLPGWLQVIVGLNPYTYVADAARSAMTGPLTVRPLVEGLVAIALVLVLTQIIVRRLVESELDGQ